MEPQPVLSESALEQFVRDGFCVLPQVVPQDQINAALRLINRELGRGLSEADMKQAEKGTYCPRASASADVASIFNAAKVQEAVATLLGKSFANTVFNGQIALRFPGALCDNNFNPVPFYDKIWHIDGLHTASNGIPEENIRNFTLLVGVMLSDVTVEFAGNLCVYPRSHHIIERYFQQSGFDAAIKKGLDGLPGLPVGKPKQILARPGDIVLCHYQLAHSIAPNTTSNIRYALYFRINRRDGSKHHPEPMLDIWLDYSDKLKQVAQKVKPSVNAVLDAHLNSATAATTTAADGSSQLLLRPNYADELFRKEFSHQITSVKEIGELRLKVQECFDRQQWSQVIEAAEKMFSLDPSTFDFESTIKAAASYVFIHVHDHQQQQPLEKKLRDLRRGEELGRKMISALPSLTEGYSIIIHSLFFQEKYADVPPVYEQMLQNAVERADEGNAAVDASGILFKALIKLGRESDFPSFANRAAEVFASKSAALRQSALSNGDIEKLQEQCWKWVFNPQKDFTAGRDMFEKLVRAKPQDFWANLIYGACLTLTGAAPSGEPFIRTAKQIDSNIPHAFTMLAQNLKAQNRNREALDAVKELIVGHDAFASVSREEDHANKIIEALEVAKQVDKTEFNQLVPQAIVKYPTLAARIKELQARPDPPGCILQ